MTSEDETSQDKKPNPAVHAAAIPDEPPAGTVIVDRRGVAWQRRGATLMTGANWHSTHRIQHLAGPLTWPFLLIEHGPVTEIHRPTEPAR